MKTQKVNRFLHFLNKIKTPKTPFLFNLVKNTPTICFIIGIFLLLPFIRIIHFKTQYRAVLNNKSKKTHRKVSFVLFGIALSVIARDATSPMGRGFFRLSPWESSAPAVRGLGCAVTLLFFFCVLGKACTFLQRQYVSLQPRLRPLGSNSKGYPCCLYL